MADEINDDPIIKWLDEHYHSVDVDFDLTLRLRVFDLVAYEFDLPPLDAVDRVDFWLTLRARD
jgi:hypothetical protein